MHPRYAWTAAPHHSRESHAKCILIQTTAFSTRETHIEPRLRAHLLHVEQRGNAQLFPPEGRVLHIHEAPAQTHAPPTQRQGNYRAQTYKRGKMARTTPPSSCAGSWCSTNRRSESPETGRAPCHRGAAGKRQTDHKQTYTVPKKMKHRTCTHVTSASFFSK